MQDSRGLFRDECYQCGFEECPAYEKSEVSPYCGYCGCPATKHKKRKIEESLLLNEDALSVPSTVPSTENSTVTKSASLEVNITNSAAATKLECLIPDLPIFSKCLQLALEKGDLGNLWDNFIMQTAAHYADCPVINTKTAYSIIGIRMYQKYPCIEAEGKKPWSKFTSALSQKMRKYRHSKKVNFYDVKGFQSISSQELPLPTPNYKVGQLKTAIMMRAESSFPQKTTEIKETIKLQKLIKEEWEKKNKEKTLIKFYLRETFSHRTDLLKEGATFETILKGYPCFSSAEYFLVEFSLMIGANEFKSMSNRLKEFFGKVNEKLQTEKKFDDTLLNSWLSFEKKTSIATIKDLRYKDVIEVTENSDEFESRVKGVPLSQSPSALLLLKEGKVEDAAVIFAGKFLSNTPKNVIGLLTTLLSIYYTLELNYPAQYVQALGALGVYLFNHKYYHLGKRALKVLESIM